MKSTATIHPGTVGAELKGPDGCLVRVFTFGSTGRTLFVFPGSGDAVDHWHVKYDCSLNCLILGIDAKLAVSADGKEASVEWEETPTAEEVVAIAFGWSSREPDIIKAVAALREAGLLNEKRDNKD